MLKQELTLPGKDTIIKSEILPSIVSKVKDCLLPL